MRAAIVRFGLYARRRPLTVTLTAIGAVVGIGLVAVVADTRRDVQVIQRQIASPCTYARGLGDRPPTRGEARQCARLLVENARQKPRRVICIEHRRVGIECPQGRPIRGEVVPLNSPLASQPSGPGDGVHVPDVPDATPPANPGAPSAPEPPEPGPAAPTPPEPPAPGPPAERPLIDLTPVTDPVCSLTRPVVAIC